MFVTATVALSSIIVTNSLFLRRSTPERARDLKKDKSLASIPADEIS